MRINEEYRVAVKDVVKFHGEAGVTVGWQDRYIPLTPPLPQRPSLQEVADVVSNIDPQDYRAQIVSGWKPREALTYSSSLEQPVRQAYIERERVLSIGRLAIPLPGVKVEEIKLPNN